MKMPKKKVETIPSEEKLPPMVPPEPSPTIATETTPIPTPSAEPTAKPTVHTSIEDQLLEAYNKAPLGPMNLAQLMLDTNATQIRLSQAWDRLYDLGKVPFSKFVKQ
jgi:hypothetical protein